MRWPERLAAGAAALLLATCAVLPAAPPSIAEQADGIRQMSGEQLLAEETRLARDGDDRAPVLRALLRAAPNHPQRDEAAARQLLEQIAADVKAAPPLRDVAAALALVIAEQGRAEAAIEQAQTRRLAEEKRIETIEARARDLERRLQETEKRAQDAEKRLQDAERRAQDAERKLEALRTIEKEMSGRAPAVR